TRQGAAFDGLTLTADVLHLQQTESSQGHHEQGRDAETDDQTWRDSETAQHRYPGLLTQETRQEIFHSR
ncbi:hypothetical protein, partial [Pseudomonas viridiflava]|uniref:hypothetical protein n=1 Tax=Pseudomonas viridiflava TaxID=33069 RepID=UPI001BAE8EA0